MQGDFRNLRGTTLVPPPPPTGIKSLALGQNLIARRLDIWFDMRMDKTTAPQAVALTVILADLSDLRYALGFNNRLPE